MHTCTMAPLTYSWWLYEHKLRLKFGITNRAAPCIVCGEELRLAFKRPLSDVKCDKVNFNHLPLMRLNASALAKFQELGIDLQVHNQVRVCASDITRKAGQLSCLAQAMAMRRPAPPPPPEPTKPARTMKTRSFLEAEATAVANAEPVGAAVGMRVCADDYHKAVGLITDAVERDIEYQRLALGKQARELLNCLN
jgi:hypothetical protein